MISNLLTTPGQQPSRTLTQTSAASRLQKLYTVHGPAVAALRDEFTALNAVARTGAKKHPGTPLRLGTHDPERHHHWAGTPA
ncbi:hypothetical protein Aut01nite_83720 [Actinoplanes utahensis]|nr:hypothetical protein Aut01nite_83720 [Actinoplanes utahensis]